jgi:p-aminobenzoyl-glutamate transporter AbgT
MISYLHLFTSLIIKKLKDEKRRQNKKAKEKQTKEKVNDKERNILRWVLVSVLLEEETGVPRENLRPAASH